MSLVAEELMEVGVVVGIHGLRGDLKVRPLPTAEGALPVARELFLRDDAGQFTACRLLRNTVHKGNCLVRLAGYEHIDAVSGLVGQSLYMRRAEMPELPAEQHYWHELEGLLVVDKQLGPLGRVEAMFATPAHPILVVQGAAGEILIPAIPQFVGAVDAETGALQVDLPEGLVPSADEV